MSDERDPGLDDTTRNGGTIVDVGIEEKMKTSYLEYSMSVIISRALPDVRDGLKPVHRRVLTAMNDLGLQPGKPYRKSAKITGDTTGNYHPHGTAAVYDTLVRLAQDFSLRYPLVDGQGNFGSVDGDAAAAERYTEARLTRFATEMMEDLDKETVDYVLNYDGSRQMPAVMPARVPNLLVNGADGIAVGMATKIPPHNLGEICDGLLALLANPEMAPEEMLQHVQGPDFPTGAVIHGRKGIFDYVTTGRGRVIVRAKAEIEVEDGGRAKIIVSEIPYQVNKAALIERIADLVRSGTIEGISDLRDESDRDGMRIVVVLKRDAFPQVVLNKLYAHTYLQSTFGVINLALVDNQPRVLSLRDTMACFLAFREEVVVRRTRFELRKAEERAHILEGYRIALDHIDAIVELIRASESPDVAKLGLMERFRLSDLQAQAILDMRLARLTGLERQKIEDEYRELIEKISYYKAVLASRALVLGIVADEIREVRGGFADPRRTEIVEDEGEIDLEDLIADEPMVVTISNQGYIKRIPVDTYRQQGRGGKGITAMQTKDDDFVDSLFVASAHQHLLVLTQKGQLFWLKVHRIPKAARAAKGRPLVNLIQIQPGDRVHAVLPIREFREDHFLLMCTNLGVVKRTPLSEFSRPRQAGIRAINLLEGERLVTVRETDGNRDVVLAASNGMAIRFHESDARPMGRTARGVRGIALGTHEEVVGMVVVDSDETEILAITENGYGKRTPIADYRPQNRGGKGLITIKCSERNGRLVGVRGVTPDEELMVITRGGTLIRIALASISLLGRNTQGVRIINLGPDDSVAGMASIPPDTAADAPEISELPDGEAPDDEQPA
ncbi:MAG TPA: DNA gyrase subunit A [Candidatus Krumholzibacteria bacterium]|nr:DNA gyrase subunit A [Candidatus Krumholzibacteria bacterium]HPD73006.1 DNA gyrase subunit A [Candidatus Krumholzibacteria bacterium]HRY41805.1 DNA gyrase subunit A [Candidatus Krumholzibacteria bacterium]